MSLPAWNEPQSLDHAAELITQLGRNIHEHAYLIGRTLIWVKRQTEHGDFLDWIENNVWFAERTARRFIVFAERCIKKNQLLRYLPGKSAIMSDLEPPPTPAGKFRTIVIDPPWPMEKIQREVRPNQADFDYPTMTIEAIKNLPIGELVDPHGCHVYLWFTQKWRRIIYELFDAWGIIDECFLTWIKNVGFTPYSWMYSTEHVLFGRVGTLPLLKLGKRLDFSAKVREHSRKPDEFYELVTEVSPEPRLDMFSREPRSGFQQWGNEVGKFEDISARQSLVRQIHSHD